MHFWKPVCLVLLTAMPVSADSTDMVAKESYVEFLSREDLSKEQNNILAACMVERLSAKGRSDLATASSVNGAELAMLADGQAVMHGSCMTQAILQAR